MVVFFGDEAKKRKKKSVRASDVNRVQLVTTNSYI